MMFTFLSPPPKLEIRVEFARYLVVDYAAIYSASGWKASSYRSLYSARNGPDFRVSDKWLRRPRLLGRHAPLMEAALGLGYKIQAACGSIGTASPDRASGLRTRNKASLVAVLKNALAAKTRWKLLRRILQEAQRVTQRCYRAADRASAPFWCTIA